MLPDYPKYDIVYLLTAHRLPCIGTLPFSKGFLVPYGLRGLITQYT